MVASTSNGHAALAATGTLTLETVSVGTGRVSISGASIVDGDAIMAIVGFVVSMVRRN